MKVEYEVTLDDLVRFNLYHLSHSPFGRRQRSMIRYGPAIIFLTLGVIEYLLLGRSSILITGWVVALVFFLATPAWWDWEVKRRTVKFMGEGNNRGITGPCLLTISQDDLQVVSDNGGGNLKWSAIEKIVASGTHTYIYSSSLSAFMIPHKAFTNDAERELFVDTARQYLANQTAST